MGATYVGMYIRTSTYIQRCGTRCHVASPRLGAAGMRERRNFNGGDIVLRES